MRFHILSTGLAALTVASIALAAPPKKPAPAVEATETYEVALSIEDRPLSRWVVLDPDNGIHKDRTNEPEGSFRAKPHGVMWGTCEKLREYQDKVRVELEKEVAWREKWQASQCNLYKGGGVDRTGHASRRKPGWWCKWPGRGHDMMWIAPVTAAHIMTKEESRAEGELERIEKEEVPRYCKAADAEPKAEAPKEVDACDLEWSSLRNGQLLWKLKGDDTWRRVEDSRPPRVKNGGAGAEKCLPNGGSK